MAIPTKRDHIVFSRDNFTSIADQLLQTSDLLSFLFPISFLPPSYLLTQVAPSNTYPKAHEPRAHRSPGDFHFRPSDSLPSNNTSAATYQAIIIPPNGQGLSLLLSVSRNSRYTSKRHWESGSSGCQALRGQSLILTATWSFMLPPLATNMAST